MRTRADGNGPRRSPTINEVARAAGVAASTVSRAFTRPGRVNAATRDHIVEVARAMGYHGGSPAAKALLRGRTETLGVLVPDIANPHFAELVRGAERRAGRSNQTLVIADTEESPAAERLHLERLSKATDGLVLVASRLADEELMEYVRHHRIVLVNRDLPNANRLLVNQRHSVEQVITHLTALGHSRIAYLAGPSASWVASQRWHWMKTAAREHGIRVAHLGAFPPFLSGGKAAAMSLLDQSATAVVAHNGLLGVGLMKELRTLGVTVPEDISVVALDDIFAAHYFSPSLSACALDQETVGDTAMAMLLDGLDDAGDAMPEQRTMLATLRVRESSGRAPESVRTLRSVADEHVTPTH